MVEEEKVFLEDFQMQNMSETNLHKADDILQNIASQGGEYRSRRKLLSGEPYYQIYKNFDYWLKFNLKYAHEERNVKLLLSLPLVAPIYHKQVKLITHKLRRTAGKKEDEEETDVEKAKGKLI